MTSWVFLYLMCLKYNLLLYFCVFNVFIYFIYLISYSHNSLPGWKMLHPSLGRPPQIGASVLWTFTSLWQLLYYLAQRDSRLILSISCSVLGTCRFYKTSWFFLVVKVTTHGLCARGAHWYFTLSAFVGVGLRDIHLLRGEKSGFYTNTSNSNLRLQDFNITF